MHPQAFQKLWMTTNGRLPHLNHEQFDEICRISRELAVEDETPFWGVVSQGLKYRGHPILRCFNFGKYQADCPMDACVVNYGMSVAARLLSVGTVNLPHEQRTFLDQLERPYLVFRHEPSSTLNEHLQPGMLVTSANVPVEQRQQFSVVLPGNVRPPTADGILFYFLSRRMPFKIEPLPNWLPAGAPAGISQFYITLQQPVFMESGWPVLLLEKDRWMWGVIS